MPVTQERFDSNLEMGAQIAATSAISELLLIGPAAGAIGGMIARSAGGGAGASCSARMVSPSSLLRTENPSKNAVKALVNSMTQNGFNPAHPIEVAEFGNKLVIVNGNTRAAAAIKAGIPQVPVTVVPVAESQAAGLADAAARFMRR